MNIEHVTEFFKWATILNVSLFMINAVLIILMRKILCKTHGKLFGISEENISIITYSWLGLYKIMILVFNIVPFVTLIIMGRLLT